MDETDLLAARFEEHRGHLLAVALRVLGSRSEAEDAVQEAWFRLSRNGEAELGNLAGWLTTVVGRVCLDMLRARKSRREAPWMGFEEPAAPGGPEQEAVLADSVGVALLVVLEQLAPAERLAFVLHDLFAVPFEEIAPVVGRSVAATRQLASRARRRVRGGSADPAVDRRRQRAVVDAFLVAARGGDLSGLLAVLDPEVVLRADPVAVAGAAASAHLGAPALDGELRGAGLVARTFVGKAGAVRPALIDGAVGGALVLGGVVRAALRFALDGERIAGIEVTAAPERVERLAVVLLD